MKHILIVEDDTLNAMLFRRVLERRGGFQVTVTGSPAELFRMVRSGEVAVVLMDISLADAEWEGRPVSGVDLCRLLKADPACAGVPVILATAHAMRGDAESLLAESGAEDYVSKPVVDHEAFVARLRQWTEREAS